MGMSNSTQDHISRHQGDSNRLDPELKLFVDTLFDWQLQRSTTAANPKFKASLKDSALAFSVGNWKAALSSLEYSQRAAPSHRGITLLMGYVRLYVSIPAATEPFEHILRSESNRETWFGLAAARLQAGDWRAASREINEGLSRHSPPQEPWMSKLAATIAARTESFGWCSLTPDGDLHLGGGAVSGTRTLQVSADQVAFDHSGKKIIYGRDVCIVRLGSLPNKASRLDVKIGGVGLLGSPINVKDVTTVTGFVTAEGGSVSGWCWYPNSDDFPVNLTVENVATGKAIKKIVAQKALLDVDAFSALSRPRRFEIPLSDLSPDIELLRIVGPGRARLYGNPLDPFGEAQSAIAASDAVAFRHPSNNTPPKPPSIPRQPSVHVTARGRLATIDRSPRPVDVVIPVYRGRARHDEGHTPSPAIGLALQSSHRRQRRIARTRSGG